jgi:HAD superfamily hydrolase (TIGR01509 family)
MLSLANTPLQALLFDLDGTLIDSMPLHQQAWAEWHRLHGQPFDTEGFFAATAGRANAEILRELYPAASAAEIETLADEKEALYRAAAATSLQLIPGWEPLRAQARALGLKLAICTASTLPNMALAFARFGLDKEVECVVSPADGVRGKPHPDIFELAARRLGVPADACLVFEDAPLGVEAARRAGMRAVALTTTLPAAAFADFDNVVLTRPDLNHIDLTELQETRHA